MIATTLCSLSGSASCKVPSVESWVARARRFVGRAWPANKSSNRHSCDITGQPCALRVRSGENLGNRLRLQSIILAIASSGNECVIVVHMDKDSS